MGIIRHLYRQSYTCNPCAKGVDFGKPELGIFRYTISNSYTMPKPHLRPDSSLRTDLRLRHILSLLALGGLLLAISFFITNDSQGNNIELTGRDGPQTITDANTIVNQYASLAAPVSAGDQLLTVDNIANLDAAQPLMKDDLLLVIQMQGASIQLSQDANFGTVLDYGQAGRYEYIFVAGVNGNDIELGSPLQFAYTTTGKTQVIRVPQYTTLELASGASLTAPAWDGSTGGIVAFTASETALLNAGSEINVSGLGFRGADYQNFYTWTQNDYYGNGTIGGRKGEGIAGSDSDYQAGGYRYGRGAPANGGGGGNGHNAGGGGGANGHNGSPWTGQGHMLSTDPGASAWSLDPGYQAASGYTTSSGGGRGGYTYSSSNRNALNTPPGHNSWKGNERRELGGLGGRGLDSDPDERLFLGGGGGAGDGNNNAGGAGGNGGGIVFIVAQTVTGEGAIFADGADGGDTQNRGNDGPGGAGGGGTVVIKALSVSALTISAEGGEGGSQFISGNEAEGPGGGGGGGYVALPANSLATVSVAGGPGGRSNSASVTEFTPNGATQGAPGMIATTIFI
ncbi:MAG: hypothetical protein D6722_01585, partial [Bacteroidetes bacterium]